MSRTLADLRANAEGLIYTTERFVEAYGSMFVPSDEGAIKAALLRLKKALESDDVVELETALLRLEAASHRMAEALKEDAAVQCAPDRATDVFSGGERPREFDALVDYFLASANALLKEHGEMAPIAAVVDRELGIAALAIDTDDEDGSADAILEQLQDGLRQGARRGEYLATGTCAVVAVSSDAAIGEALALELALDHLDGASLVVRVPFVVKRGELDRLELGAAIVREGAHDVFPPVV